MVYHFRRLATSHFEPTYARHAFPCFDEPQLKAKVLMTIIHDKGLVAFFNTPKRESLEIHGKPNWVRTQVQEESWSYIHETKVSKTIKLYVTAVLGGSRVI